MTSKAEILYKGRRSDEKKCENRHLSIGNSDWIKNPDFDLQCLRHECKMCHYWENLCKSLWDHLEVELCMLLDIWKKKKKVFKAKYSVQCIEVWRHSQWAKIENSAIYGSCTPYYIDLQYHILLTVNSLLWDWICRINSLSICYCMELEYVLEADKLQNLVTQFQN